MRWFLPLAVAALVSSSCGVIADDVAASYGGTEFSTQLVDSLASDARLAPLIGLDPVEGGGAIEGTVARAVLDFLLQGQAIVDQAERQGITVKEDGDLLQQVLDGGEQPVDADDLSEEVRTVLARFVSANQALSQTGLEPDPPTEDDLRYVYDELDDGAQWERICLTLVSAPTESVGDVRDSLAGGTALAEIPGEVEGAQLEVDAEAACVPTSSVDLLPTELSEGILAASPGEVDGPVQVALPDGTELAAWFEVDSTSTLSFTEARAELGPLLSTPQSSLALSIARNSEVNSRYGDGIELAVRQPQAQAPDQSSAPVLVASVGRPPAPEPTPLLDAAAP